MASVKTKTQPVRIDSEVLRKVRILCAVRGGTASEWLTRAAEVALAKESEHLPPAV